MNEFMISKNIKGTQFIIFHTPLPQSHLFKMMLFYTFIRLDKSALRAPICAPTEASASFLNSLHGKS